MLHQYPVTEMKSTRSTYSDRQTHRQPFNGLFSRTTWVSQHQKG